MVKKCVGLLIFLSAILFVLYSCGNKNDIVQNVTDYDVPESSSSKNTTIDEERNVNLTENSKEKAELTESERENQRLLDVDSKYPQDYRYYKMLYPAEKVFDMEIKFLPEKINNQYYELNGMVDFNTFLVRLVEEFVDPQGGHHGRHGEDGIYNIETGEYTKIFYLDKDYNYYKLTYVDKDNYIIQRQEDDGNMLFELINIKENTSKILYKLDNDKYWFMTDVYLVGRDLCIPERNSKLNFTIRCINVDTLEEKILGNGLNPQQQSENMIWLEWYDGVGDGGSESVDYKKVKINGSDFEYTWNQLENQSEAIANVHNSMAAHESSNEIYVITKIVGTEEEGTETKMGRCPLYVIRKHTKNNPSGEKIVQTIRGKNENLYIGMLKFNGRFVSWYDESENKNIIYDNKRDVLLYFNAGENKYKPYSFYLSLVGNSGYIELESEFHGKKYEGKERSWENRYRGEKSVLLFNEK